MSPSSSHALLVLLLLAGCAAGEAARTPSPDELGGPSRVDLTELIHAAVNEARLQAGRRRLVYREDLAAVALAHSRDMAARAYFGHLSPEGRDASDRARRAGAGCRRSEGGGFAQEGVGENLSEIRAALPRLPVRRGEPAARGIPAPRRDLLVREVVEGWLRSPAHRRALLDARARAHGLGVAFRPDSTVLVTEVLC